MLNFWGVSCFFRCRESVFNSPFGILDPSLLRRWCSEIPSYSHVSCAARNRHVRDNNPQIPIFESKLLFQTICIYRFYRVHWSFLCWAHMEQQNSQNTGTSTLNQFISFLQSVISKNTHLSIIFGCFFFKMKGTTWMSQEVSNRLGSMGYTTNIPHL